MSRRSNYRWAFFSLGDAKIAAAGLTLRQALDRVLDVANLAYEPRKPERLYCFSVARRGGDLPSNTAQGANLIFVSAATTDQLELDEIADMIFGGDPRGIGTKPERTSL